MILLTLDSLELHSIMKERYRCILECFHILSGFELKN